MSTVDSIGFGLEGVQFTDYPMPVGKIELSLNPSRNEDLFFEQMGTVTGRMPPVSYALLTQVQLDQIGEYFGIKPWVPNPFNPEAKK